MANQLWIPRANPLQIVEESPTQAAQFNSRHMDDYWLREQLRTFETRVHYKQKWQTNDVIYLQFESNFDPLQVEIIDCDQTVYLTLLAVKRRANIYQDGFFAYELAISLATIPQGTYFAVFTLGGGDTKAISEPFEVHEKLPNSLLFQYRNTRYHRDVIYETGIQFWLRVDQSMIRRLNPGNERTAYRDQKLNPTTLRSVPFRTWTLVLGYQTGIPDWLVDKMNEIFSCGEVYIDGKLYSVFEESDFEDIELDPRYPLRTWTLNIQDGINRASKIIAPSLPTDIKLVVGYNINTRLFGDLSDQAGSNLVPIIDTE